LTGRSPSKGFGEPEPIEKEGDGSELEEEEGLEAPEIGEEGGMGEEERGEVETPSMSIMMRGIEREVQERE
jgi:hypothetical protein